MLNNEAQKPDQEMVKSSILKVLILLCILYSPAIIIAQQANILEIKLPDEIRSINAIFVTSDKLWLATAQGLYSYTDTVFTRYYDESLKESYLINTISKDRAGNMWFGNYNGLLVKFSGNRILETIDIKPQCKTDNYLITSISIDNVIENKNTEILLTTSGGEIIAYDTISRSIKKMKSPGEGTIYSIKYGYYPIKWLCTSDGFFSMTKNNQWKKKAGLYTVYDIVQNAGKYWGIGRDTDKKAMMMLYYNESDKPDKYAWKEFDLQKLDDKYIRFNELAFTKDEIAWIASEKGLIRYNPTNADLTLFSHAQGFELKAMKHVVVQSNEIIWVSSSGRHLYKVEIK